MADIINMPKLGLTMTEGVVLWKKQVGDLVHMKDVVFEVETDKLTNEVESEFEGVLLKQMCEEGGEIPCTQPVAVIGKQGEMVEINCLQEDASSEVALATSSEAALATAALPSNCSTIAMPKLGLTMTEGIVTWKKELGDTISPGDVVFEVETDKLTNEVEANEDCVGVLLQKMCEDGEEIACTKVVAVIGPAGTVLNMQSKAVTAALVSETTTEATTEATTEVAAQKHVSVANGGYIIASPIAKKIAKDNGFSLSEVVGSGPNGRIVLKDVESYLAAGKVKISPTAAKMAAELGVDVSKISSDSRIMKNDIQHVTASQIPTAVQAEEKTVKLSGMRKTISKRMKESWSTSPRVCYNMTVDTSAMTELKNKLSPLFKEAGTKLTFNHILTKVCARVLVEMPEINGSLKDDILTLHSHVNIGMAVGMDNGLIVPNVKNCEEKSLLQIAMDTEASIDKARNNKLTPDEMSGGTFTISNLGMYGIESFSPIINQPELAILGVNAIIQTPIVIDKEIVIRPMMTLSLVADHRVVDGLKAAQCLKRIKTYLENPYMLLA